MQPITKEVLLPDNNSYICSRLEMSSCVRNPPQLMHYLWWRRKWQVVCRCWSMAVSAGEPMF